jgi:hypothetical protein
LNPGNQGKFLTASVLTAVRIFTQHGKTLCFVAENAIFQRAEDTTRKGEKREVFLGQ